MDEVRLLQSLGQFSESQTAEIFHDFLCGCVRESIREVIAAEVTKLCGVSGDSHLTADVVRDVTVASVFDHRFGPGFSETGLEATGFVIDPGMDATEIPSGLMEGEFDLVFEQDGPRPRRTPSQLPRRH